MKRFLRFQCALGIIASCQAEAALSDPVPPVFVGAGSDDAGMAACNISYTAATASAEAAFRYNRVQLVDKNAYFQDKGIAFNIDITAFEITRGSGASTGSCAISTIVYLGTGTKTFDPVAKNIKWAVVHYCDRGSLYVLDKLNTQRTVNDQITQYVNQCVSEYENIKPST